MSSIAGLSDFEKRLQFFEDLNSKASSQPIMPRINSGEVLRKKEIFEKFIAQMSDQQKRPHTVCNLPRPMSPVTIRRSEETVLILIKNIIPMRPPEYIGEEVLKQKTQQLLSNLKSDIDEKDDDGFPKRRKPYIISLQNEKLAWVPMSQGPRLLKEEEKKAIEALQYVLNVLDMGLQHGITEIRGKKSTRSDSLAILLNKVLDITWAKKILADKSQTQLRNSVLFFFYKFYFGPSIQEMVKIDAFLASSEPLIRKLVAILEEFQIAACAQAQRKIFERGEQQMLKPVQEESPRKGKGVSQKMMGFLTPRNKEVVTTVHNPIFHAMSLGLKSLSEQEITEMAKELGVLQVCNQLNRDDCNNYLLKIFNNPSFVSGCYDERTITSMLESFEDNKKIVGAYLSFNAKWKTSTDIDAFILNSVPEEKTPKVQAAYCHNDFSECVRLMFHQGNLNPRIHAFVKDVIKRAFMRLEEINCPHDVLEKFKRTFEQNFSQSVNWKAIAALFNQLIDAFEKMKIQ